MHTDTSTKETPTEDAYPTADNAHSQTVTNPATTDKVFHSIRAAYALHGHSLHRTDPNDGTVRYWAERWRMVCYLPTIDTARQFLEQIGGRL